MNWFVLYVNSRAEQKVSERLSLKGLEVFCPLQTEVRQWSDRKKKVKTPYFRSYVFARFDTKNRTKVLQTPGVVGFLYWLGKPAVIRDDEMQEVMHFFDEHASTEIVCESFEPGQNVLVKEGPLQQQKGVVLRQSKLKVVLQIQQLGISLTAEVPKDKVVSVE
ncbi:MAG TPA: UpxY family transcription antiterminator [Flavobacteriaceae bacterium]|nr:UpxY family transcription antiterminator [Flavobacteriaceae bacterium]